MSPNTTPLLLLLLLASSSSVAIEVERVAAASQVSKARQKSPMSKSDQSPVADQGKDEDAFRQVKEEGGK